MCVISDRHVAAILQRISLLRYVELFTKKV